MKLNKLLNMLFAIAFMTFGVVEDGTGGDAGTDAAGTGGDAGTDAAGTDAAGTDAGTDAAAKGKPHPTDEEARLLKEVMDKKAALKKSRSDIEALQAKLAQFDGIDIDGVKKLLAEKQAAETRKLEEQGQWDSVKKQMVSEFDKERTALKDSLTESQNENNALKSTIAELTVGSAFVGSEFIKEDLTMPARKARALYGAHFDFNDGVVVAFDKPAGAADRAVMVDAKGDPLDFDAALKKLVDADPDREHMLKSKIKPGSGSNTRAKGAPDAKIDPEMSGKDRIALALSKGALVKK